MVVLAIVGAAGGAWAGGLLNPLLAASEQCTSVTRLVVVADGSIAEALGMVAADFDESSSSCVKTDVQTRESADAAAIFAAGGGSKADVWVPDSEVWLDRMNATASSLGRPLPVVTVGESIASTPLVLAAPAARADEFGSDPVGWTGILAGKVAALVPNPEQSAASLAGLLLLRANSSAADPRQFAGAMIELGKTVPSTPGDAFAAALNAERPTVVVTTERIVAGLNEADPADPFVAIYPTEGTTSVGYPFVRLAGGDSAVPIAKRTGEKKGAAATRADMVDDLEAAIRDASSTFAADGFRNPDGSGTLDLVGVLEKPVAAAAAGDGPGQIEILRSWGILTLRSRMLAVIDVSGSMLEPASGGLRRIDVFQQAALGAMQKFSGEVELGVWIFSTARSGDQDWEDLSPIAPLADTAHTQQIAQIIASLPDRASGGTGLYDTTLAAVKRVRENYDPDKVNSVLLITDGRNEDENGIDLPILLAELAQLNDPLKPVPVIMIGFGPDTDLAAMTQIAKSTGGAAYSANRPEDLGTVLVDALSQRACRPNC